MNDTHKFYDDDKHIINILSSQTLNAYINSYVIDEYDQAIINDAATQFNKLEIQLILATKQQI
jgi:hypothetical protein